MSLDIWRRTDVQLKGLAMFLAMTMALAGSARAQVPQPAQVLQQAPPAAPDYDLPSSWARSGGGTPDEKDRPAVFYVHPTTDRSMEHWNQDSSDAANNHWTDVSVMARQAAIFDRCCSVYAPRYRQASRLALFNMEGRGKEAFDLAYSDVERAFDHFIARIGDRPFILAGHSQGAFHLARLLERRVDQTALANRMIVAYVVGLNLSEGEFGKTYKAIGICDRPRQVRCVAGWNAVLGEADRVLIARNSEKRYVERYGDDPGKMILCINPLTFDRRKPAARDSASAGAAPGDPGEGPLRNRISGKVAAHCDNGSLVVQPAAELGLAPLPGGSMHYHDFGLFFADVEKNVALRIKQYRRMHRIRN